MDSRKQLQSQLNRCSSGSESGGEPAVLPEKTVQSLTYEIECRYEARIAEQQNQHREEIARVERDRDTQLSALTDRLAAAESEATRLRHEIYALQNMVTSLTVNNRSTAAERYAHATAENALLQEMFDEQIKEIESRCEVRIAEVKEQHREEIARVERDRDAQLSALTDRLDDAELEATHLRHEVGRLGGYVETLRDHVDVETRSAREAEEAALQAAAELSAAREALRREREEAETVRVQLAAAQLELRSLKAAPLDLDLD